MNHSVSLARYLFSRLKSLGVDHVHGVPGDYTLKAIDHLQRSGLKWIGSCNELNAGYAADGYARVKGLGALFTTYGVGELSAINAVAGSYAEQVPVVHIVGSPSRRMQNSGAKVHHTLGDGRTRVFAEIHEKVTAAQAHLWDAHTAPQMIDDTLKQCLEKSLPVYMEIPCDMVPVNVPSDKLDAALDPEIAAPNEDDLVEEVLQSICKAKQPLLLVDRGFGMPQIRSEINQLVEKSGIATLTLPSGGGMVDHSISNYFGVHSGPVGQIDTMPFLNSSDLVIALGPLFADTQTLGWSIVPDPSKTITICNQHVQIASSSPRSITARSFVRKLIDRLDRNQISTGDVSLLGDFRSIKAAPADPSSLIDQDSLYLRLNSYLRPDDVILLGNATPIIGGRDFVLPPRARIIASGMWFSIEHMLPAAQGVAVAQRGIGRTILFDGDGSFQTTAQELSTIIRERLDMTIFIINNGGYAYERQIHGMDEGYNDIAPWRYLEAPSFFGAPDDYPIEIHQLQTWRDLDRLLDTPSFHDGKGLKLVEVMVGKYDVPDKFRPVFQKAGEQL